jgi:hypothetical protein
MKKIYCIVIALFFARILTAQAQTAVRPTVTELDVDRVYNLYKDTSDIVIKTGGREIKAKIKISLNALDKPYSIIAYGETDANVDEVLQKLKTELGITKLQSGYKQSPGMFPVSFNPTGTYEHVIPISYFQKGTQSAKYGIQKIMYTEQDVNGMSVKRHVGDFFYFEVCDEGRRNTFKPGDKFVF